MFNWFKSFRTSTASSAPVPVATSGTGRAATPSRANARAQELKRQGDAHFNQGSFDKAAACYQQAIACDPEYAEAYNNWGNACQELNLMQEAEHCLRRAVEIKPGMRNVSYNLAYLLLTRGEADEALHYLAQEVKQHPTHYAALALMLNQKQKQCIWRDLEAGISTLRASLRVNPTAPEHIFSPFAFAALPGTTAEEQRICAERWWQSEYLPQAALRPKLNLHRDRPHGNKINIGYLSADFREHPVARLMAEVFELHDRERFHLCAYSYGPDDGSELRQRLTRTFDMFVDLRGISDANAAQRIYADNTDVLVDLTGYTRDSRSGILAFKPAATQLNYLGYPGTMGTTLVDYIITDRFAVPPEARSHFTEKTIYLPDCMLPYDRQTMIADSDAGRKSWGLPEDAFVFCCFNDRFKITQDVFAVWMRLLGALPDSVLWLSDGGDPARQNLRLEAARHGVDSARVLFAPRVKAMADHLARYRLADLFLDTFPYNAHTTCMDALWAGLPVITCSGQTLASRIAGSLLHTIGMPRLVTHSLQDYFELALFLARNRAELDVIRNRLRGNLRDGPLFDSVRFTRALEGIYFDVSRERANDMAM